MMRLMCCLTAGSSKVTGSDSLSAIRSSSTLPIAEPSSEPPTPTRMAGTANTFQFEDRGEDRGDLIKFYNSVSNFCRLCCSISRSNFFLLYLYCVAVFCVVSVFCCVCICVYFRTFTCWTALNFV